MIINNYPEENAKLIRLFLLGKGLNEYAVAGILGNLYAESRLRPNNLQNTYEAQLGNDEAFTKAVDNGTFAFLGSSLGFGYGLAQWTSKNRRNGLYNYLKASGRSIADLMGQLEYLWIELNGSYKKSVLDVLLNCTSVREAAEVVVCKFEVPQSVINGGTSKENTINTRAAYAQDFYDLYADKTEVINMSTKILALSAGHYPFTAGKRCHKALDPNETREWFLNDRISDKLENILAGYNRVKVIRVGDTTGQRSVSLAQRAKTSDDAKADFYLAVHHNAGINLGYGGGVVVYYYPTERNKDQATQIYNHIVGMNGLRGNRSEPIKATKTLYEVYKPKADAILLEAGFMDSRVDTPIILTEDYANKTAQALANFFISYWKLTKKDGAVIAPVAPVVNPELSYKVRVTTSALNIRAGAGTSYKVTGTIRDKGVYTIVETKDNWGKLKSGAGWISLAYTKRV